MSKKGKPQPYYGNVKGAVIKMLAERPRSIPEMLTEREKIGRPWSRAAIDNAMLVLKEAKIVRLQTEDLVDRPDGAGKMRVKIWEVTPPDLITAEADALRKTLLNDLPTEAEAKTDEPAKPKAGDNLRIESNVALLDELTSITEQIAYLRAKQAAIRERLAVKLEGLMA